MVEAGHRLVEGRVNLLRPTHVQAAVVVALALLPSLVKASPQDAVLAAAKDVSRLTPEIAKRTRYLSLYAVPEVQREQFLRVLAGHLNLLSLEPDLVKPVVVGQLVRVNLDDYGWRASTWDQLKDPYFTVTLRTNSSGSGTGKPKKSGKGKKGKSSRSASRLETVLAPWLATSPEARTLLSTIIARTQAKVSVVDARWFLYQTGAQADRKPGYYDFLGIKDQKTFERIVGFSGKLMKDSRRKELLEAVAISGVAQQPRRIGVFPTLGPLRLWKTFDNKVAIDKRNPLRVLNGGFQFDATEEFGPLPNGLWVFGLFDSQGQRQDSAPDFVGGDHTSVSNDKRIHVGVSCIRCHWPNAGINPIDSWARSLLSGPLVLRSPDPKKARELRQLYLRDLEGPIEDDRRTFTRTLKGLTDLTPKEYAAAYGDFWADYEAPVTLDRAARDLGTTPKQFKAALEKQARGTGYTDTVLAVYLLPRPGVIPRRQWEEAYGLAQQTMRAYR